MLYNVIVIKKKKGEIAIYCISKYISNGVKIMLRQINQEYDNEILVGRVGYIEEKDSGSVRIAFVENYDARDEDPNWVNVIASGKVAEGAKKLNSKDLLKGAIVTAILRTITRPDWRISRYVHSFKVTRFPRRKIESESSESSESSEGIEE